MTMKFLLEGDNLSSNPLFAKGVNLLTMASTYSCKSAEEAQEFMKGTYHVLAKPSPDRCST